MRIVPEGQLVYGMQLPIQAQSTVFVEEWERDCGPDELARLARKADRSGFFYVAVCDHVAIPEHLAPAMGTTWYDTIATLGFLAAETDQIRLMSHVWIMGYRHPLQSAKSFATLDHLSKGRIIIGVGAGHVEKEFTMLGAEFEHRGGVLDESIDALVAALTDEFPVHHGARWDFEGLGIAPRPIQRPRPPIWIGGSSPAAQRRAGRKGDGWLPQGTPRAQMPEQIAAVRRARADAGIDDPIDIGTISEFFYVGDPPFDVGKHAITGSPERIAESLVEFKEMGVTHAQVRFRSRSVDELEEQIGAFASDVIPLVDKA
jgi:probable F420-dependent oxidoreductase